MPADTLRDLDHRDAGVQPVSPLDELLTAQQVAALLQLRLSTVEDYARRRVLPSLKLGRHRRFLRSQVEQAITALAEESELR